MTATQEQDQPSSTSDSWQIVAARLRERDHDLAFDSADVLDVYARISRNPDDGETEKTDRQLLDCLREVDRRGVRLGRVLRDDNKSAWQRSRKRPGWDVLVDRLKNRQAQGVVVWHTDRLLRQPFDLELLIQLADSGLTVASCFGEYDLGDADARFTLRVLTAAACKESDNTSRRQQRKAAARREAGYMGNGQRAFGHPGRGVDDEQLARERAALVEAIDAYLDRGEPLASIARRWNELALTTTNGNIWDGLTVKKALNKPRHAALYEAQPGALRAAANVEPIISVERYEQIAASFAARRKGRPYSGEHILSGIGRCECGRELSGLIRPERYSATYDDGEPRRRYRCKSCGLAVDARIAERWVRAQVIARLSDPAHAEQVARRSRAVAAVSARIADAERTAVALADRLGRGELSLGRFDAATAPLDARIERLTAERDELLKAGADEHAQAESADALEDLWDDERTTAAERRAMIVRAIPKGFTLRKGARGSDERFVLNN